MTGLDTKDTNRALELLAKFNNKTTTVRELDEARRLLKRTGTFAEPNGEAGVTVDENDLGAGC